MARPSDRCQPRARPCFVCHKATTWPSAKRSREVSRASAPTPAHLGHRRAKPVAPSARRCRSNLRPVEHYASAKILRSEEHTSELQSHVNLVCRLLLEKKKKKKTYNIYTSK